MNALIRLFLYSFIAMVPIACGTRKANTNTQNFEQQETDKQSSSGQVKTGESNTTTEQTTTQNNKVDEQQEKRVRELFNENGTLKERITELLNKKSTDNSTSSKSSTQTRYVWMDSTFNKTIYRTRTITIKVKEKEVDRSNNGWYWVVGVLGIVGLAFWLKPWASR